MYAATAPTEDVRDALYLGQGCRAEAPSNPLALDRELRKRLFLDTLEMLGADADRELKEIVTGGEFVDLGRL